jgi:hypothetical protein
MWHLEGYVRAASFGESGMRSGRGRISWTPRLVPSEPAMSSGSVSLRRQAVPMLITTIVKTLPRQ